MRNHQSTVMPYGAYELKAAYQRNLLSGMLCVMALTILIFGTVDILAKLTATDMVLIDPIKTVGDTIILLPPPKTIHNTPPAPSGPPPQELHGAVPVAIEDSLIGDTDALVPTQEQLGAQIGSGADSGSGTYVDNASAQSVVDPFPSDTEFVPVEKTAEPVFMQKPIYPLGARHLGIEGTVIIKALVDKEGMVRDTRLVRSSGYDELDRAALEAAMLCRYSPAIQNGLPKAIWVSYRVVFNLSE